MKISRYAHFFRSKRYGCLLYSGETNSFAKIDEQLFDSLKEIENNPAKIEELDEVTKQELVRSKIIVENQDQIVFEKRFRYYHKAFDATNLGLIIAPTRACNFNCPYCYEDDKPVVHMSRETESDVIKFINKHKLVSRVNITWYGGEPLLKFDSIQRILHDFESKRDTNKKMGLHAMTTNGYLLDEDKCLFFQKYPLDNIQITIDGNKETHDKRRTLIPNIPTFDKIIENIDRFNYYNPDTLIQIRTNLDNSNIDTFPSIFKEFNEKWLDKGRNVVTYPAFVKDFSESCKTNCLLLNRTQKLDFFVNLQRKHGIDISFYPEYCVGGCGATVLNCYVVGPEGELYKCWNDLGTKEAIVGYLNSDEIVNFDLLTRYMAGPSMIDSQKCLDCKLLTICDGGCIWEWHQNIFENKEYDYMCHTRKANIDYTFELHYEKTLMQQKVKNNQ
jgi:uncharacterized protein